MILPSIIDIFKDIYGLQLEFYVPSILNDKTNKPQSLTYQL